MSWPFEPTGPSSPPSWRSTRFIAMRSRRCSSAFARDITERKRAEERLAYQATHDALTGLPNRARFQSEAGAASRRTPRSGRCRSPCCWSISTASRRSTTHSVTTTATFSFKGWGRACVTPCAAPGTLARIGGDEFGILLPGADGAQAIRAAEAVLAAVRQPVVVKGQALDVGASIGVALCPDHTRDPVALYAMRPMSPCTPPSAPRPATDLLGQSA